MNKVEAQIVKRPSIDPVTVANNANQALYKNCRQWREYATALEEDVRNLSERVVELDSQLEKKFEDNEEFQVLKDELETAWGSHKKALAKIEKLIYESQRLELENLAIKALMEKAKKQQPYISEVPQFVADWLDRMPLYAINNSIPVEVIGWSQKQIEYADLGMNINHLIKLKVNGYTVDKEKLFYLKHIDMSKKYNSNVCVLAHGEGNVIYGHYEFPVGVYPSDSDYIFTQQEIDSMETGSYEQIEVEE